MPRFPRGNGTAELRCSTRISRDMGRSQQKKRERASVREDDDVPSHAGDAAPRPRPDATEWRPLAFFLAVVALLVAATHWPALGAGAHGLDDDWYLTENPLVQRPSVASAMRFLTEVRNPSTIPGYYHPLAMISLMLDYASAGRADDLRPFHRTSLLLH